MVNGRFIPRSPDTELARTLLRASFWGTECVQYRGVQGLARFSVTQPARPLYLASVLGPARRKPTERGRRTAKRIANSDSPERYIPAKIDPHL
jgi:hypothetical protein